MLTPISAAIPMARNARREWTRRSGLLLELRDSALVGRGEASPLPGYSPDDLDACRRALEGVRWEDLPAADAPHALEGLASVGNLVPATLPAARFALETAWLDLAAQRGSLPVWSLLREEEAPAAAVPLAALVDGTSARDLVVAAEQAIARGIRTLKVKIGRDLDGELRALGVLRAAIGGSIGLRLDANGALDPREAPSILASLADLDPEFIEEPVPPAALASLPRVPIPIALDESLQPADAWERLERWIDTGACGAVVLKPTTLGGVARCLDLADRASARGLRVVFSHTLEGPVAFAACAHLALAAGTPGVAAGLDRHAGLAAWPAMDVPAVGATTLFPSQEPGLALRPTAPSPERAP